MKKLLQLLIHTPTRGNSVRALRKLTMTKYNDCYILKVMYNHICKNLHPSDAFGILRVSP